MRFTAKGHPNITGTHKTTLEFTKDDELSEAGDCILGIEATFDIEKIKPLLKKETLVMIIKVDGEEETITFTPNPQFSSPIEMVIRKSDFLSSRTLGTKADKSCKDMPRSLIKKLREGHQARVTIEAAQ